MLSVQVAVATLPVSYQIGALQCKAASETAFQTRTPVTEEGFVLATQVS